MATRLDLQTRPGPDRLKTQPCDDACACPVCSSPNCMERPRYFAGQLLTEAELNSEQSYVVAKNRLHNRYLHGSGIICGLQVTCHDCEGWVTVQPGYALDPCGNDLLVCEPQDFDLIKAIRACREAGRRERECDPLREPVRGECRDVEEDWCLTIRYREVEGKPTAALTSQSPSSCGCGCSRPNGSGKKCACGCNCSASRSCGCGGKGGSATGRTVSLGACEPSRTLEGFELGVLCLPREEDSQPEAENFIFQLLELLEKFGYSLSLECLMECLAEMQAFALRMVRIRVLLVQNPFGAAATIYRDLCRLREDVRKYLLDAARTNCLLLDRLAQVFCPPPPAIDNELPAFVEAVMRALVEIHQILAAQMKDCLCFQSLPSCPPDPCEDRLILACVTVRGNRIQRICDTDRSYVAAPHNLLPVFIHLLFDRLCCREIEPLPDTVPAGGQVDFVSATIAQVGLHSPSAAILVNAVRAFSGLGVTAFQPDEATLDGTAFIGRPAEEVRQVLAGQVAAVVEARVSWTLAEQALHALEAPLLRKGEPVRMFVDAEGRVAGFGRYSETERLRRELDDARGRIDRLEAQLADLSKGASNRSKS